MWQLHKTATGERSANVGVPYTCDTGRTAQGETQIRLILTTGGPSCDQNPGLIPDNSVFKATGNTIRRASGLAHFYGTFTITNPATEVLFSGTIEAIDQIGTHHTPFGTEACDEQGHLEGWLVGQGSSLLPNHTLRALIVARASFPASGGAPAPVHASINGALIKCP